MARSIASTHGLWVHAFTLGVAVVSAGACRTSGVEQLTDTSPRNVFFPGKSFGSVSEGEFPIGVLGRRGLVSAVVTMDGEDVLRLHALDGERVCRSGPVARDENGSLGGLYADSDDYLAYQERLADGNARLHVLDARCREPIGPYPNGTLIGNPAGYQPTSLLILDEARILRQLRTEDGRHRILARNVSEAVQTSSHLFTVEDGELTVRNREFQKLRTLGQGVSELAVDTGNSRVAYIDEGGLFVLSTLEQDPQFVTKAACKVAWIDAPAAAAAVQYQKTCEDPSLVVAISAYERRVDLPSGTTKSVSLRNFGTDSSPQWVLSYLRETGDTEHGDPVVTDPSGSTFEALRRFIGRVGEPAVEIGLTRTYRSISSVTDGRILLWLDPGTARSRLVSWSPKYSTDYLKNVTDFVPSPPQMRALVARERGADLYDVSPDRAPKRVLEDAYGTGKHGSAGSLLFSSVASHVGDVSYMASDGETTEMLFSAALVPSASLIWDESAAIALTDLSVQNRRGTLCVRLIVSADTFCQRNVTAFVPTYRPSFGVAYVSRADGASKLHWAQAR